MLPSSDESGALNGRYVQRGSVPALRLSRPANHGNPVSQISDRIQTRYDPDQRVEDWIERDKHGVRRSEAISISQLQNSIAIHRSSAIGAPLNLSSAKALRSTDNMCKVDGSLDRRSSTTMSQDREDEPLPDYHGPLRRSAIR